MGSSPPRVSRAYGTGKIYVLLSQLIEMLCQYSLCALILVTCTLSAQTDDQSFFSNGFPLTTLATKIDVQSPEIRPFYCIAALDDFGFHPYLNMFATSCFSIQRKIVIISPNLLLLLKSQIALS